MIREKSALKPRVIQRRAWNPYSWNRACIQICICSMTVYFLNLTIPKPNAQLEPRASVDPVIQVSLKPLPSSSPRLQSWFLFPKIQVLGYKVCISL